jgi:hypothetical protein
MYLRYRAKYYNTQTGKIAYGFFWAADYLQKHGDLHANESKALEELIHWFDHQLPIPDYYQDEKNRQQAKSATSWYKDTALEFIGRMNRLAEILNDNGVEVERISAKKLRGTILYEDDHQVTVIPFRDVKNRTE